jgi:hypothetical protein
MVAVAVVLAVPAEAARAVAAVPVVETVLLNPEVLVAVDRAAVAVVGVVVLAGPGAADRAVIVLENLVRVALAGQAGRVVLVVVVRVDFLPAAFRMQRERQQMRLVSRAMLPISTGLWAVVFPVWEGDFQAWEVEPTTLSRWR